MHDQTTHCPDTTVTAIVGVIPPPITYTVAQLCGTQLSPPLQVPAGAIGPYSWTENAITTVLGTLATITCATAVAPTDYFFVTYTDPTTHCEDSLKTTLSLVTIDFNPTPFGTCNGGTNGYITLTPINGTNFPAYSWTVNGLDPRTAFGNNSDSTLTHLPPLLVDSLGGGTYVVVITPAGNPSCAYTYTYTLVPGAIPPAVLATLKGCALDTIYAAPPADPTNGYSNSWYAVPGTLLHAWPLQISGPLIVNNPTYTDTIRNAAGCKSVYKVTIKTQSFNASISSAEAIHCHGDSSGKIKATASSEVNGPLGHNYTFTWTYPSPYSASSPGILTTGATPPQSTQETSLHPGTYTVVIRSGNCIATETYSLINPAPLNTDTLNSFYCPKDDSALLCVTELGHPKYIWLFNHVPVPNYSNDSMWVKTGDVNSYMVAYLDHNCKDTAKTLIYFPSWHAFRPDTLVNIFTPNGDNRNDIFYPFYGKGFTQFDVEKQTESFHMYIYNRWGKLVFETEEYLKAWTGHDQSGAEQDDGTYYYILKYKSNCSTKADIVTKKGFVQLLR